MKTIKQSWDIEEVKNVLCKEDAYQSIAYDGSPDVEEFVPDFKNSAWFILKEDGNVAGFIKMDYLSNIMWNCHVSICQQYRGNNSEEWGKLVSKEMNRKYGAKKFLAITPYIQAKKYAERIGFKYVVTLFSSIVKNNKTLDQYMLEMNSGEERICQ